MRRFRLRPEAEADLEAIVRYIAEDNPSASLRWLDNMYERCRRIAEMPGIGVARSDIRPNLRVLTAGNYLILYQRVEGAVEIVRVVHGARQWRDLL